MQTPPEEATSNAAAWLEVFGAASWGEGFTPATDIYIQIGLYGVAALVFVGLVVELLWRWRRRRKSARRKQAQDFGDFDMSILDAVEHMMQTVPHSWDSPDKAERFFFRAIHKQMKAGRLRVMGAATSGGRVQRISKKQLSSLSPESISGPETDTTPYGVRFELIDKAEIGEPRVLSDGFPGFSDIRLRSRDVYRLWPRTRSQNGGEA